MKLTECQEKGLQILNQDSNVFLTGGAGTGKSFLIREFMKTQNKKTFPILASTGAAAVLVGGRTFHSFFGLGIMEGGVGATIERAARNKRTLSRIRRCEGVIIDEVSMLSGPTLQAAEKIARLAFDNHEPWGGLRIIAVGDFAQLPPVQRGIREWAFEDAVWRASEFASIELKTIVRTQDEDFIDMLSFVRRGEINDFVREYLNSKMSEPGIESEGTRLFSRRAPTDQFNLQKLGELDSPLVEIPTIFQGDERSVQQLLKHGPLSEKLLLKKGAYVMIRQNDPKQRWVNGSLATVEDFFDDSIALQLESGRIVEVEKTSFSLLNAEGKEVAVAVNFPISLAWASTIHKAQGATLDKMIVQLKSLWEPGQAYVALSRLRSGQGLALEGWDPKSIIVDQRVVQFYESLN